MNLELRRPCLELAVSLADGDTRLQDLLDVESVPPQDNRMIPLGLVAATRSAAIPPEDDYYGPMIGDWNIRSVIHQSDGSEQTSLGVWSFRWVLSGIAIQDVIGARAPGEHGNWYAGITLRYYEPKNRGWRIVYVEPFTASVESLLARREGTEIVQRSQNADVQDIFANRIPTAETYGNELD
ncbi:MAG: hypothetical protein ACYDDQ_00005 [Vulcanimicrobiaceae bacterium]